MDLILDIGNFRIKGASFQDDEITGYFSIGSSASELERVLEGKTFDRCLISSVNAGAKQIVEQTLKQKNIPFDLLDYSTVKIKLDVEDPASVGHDRIANVYGALFRFPQNDCIVVDMGTAVTFDYVGSNGSFLGGAIYPGVDIGAKALASYTDKLPEVPMEIPEAPIGKTTETNIQSGLYYGLLGAIERVTFEMRRSAENPSNVKVIATGGLLTRLGEDFVSDLGEIVDLIDPALTLIGIHEILKEKA